MSQISKGRNFKHRVVNNRELSKTIKMPKKPQMRKASYPRSMGGEDRKILGMKLLITLRPC